jgi:hypothetical protein
MRKFSKVGMILMLVVSICALTMSSTVVAAPSAKGVSHRPIEDLIVTQGTYNGNFLSYINNEWIVEISVDYAGLDNQAIIDGGGEDLGTTITGSITEKVLADGRTLVRISLHAKNALTRSIDWSIGDYIFGSTVAEVLDGAHASLGECKFDMTYITTAAPGSDMPDLLEMAYYGIEGYSMVSVNFVATSKGELNEAFGVEQGTPGMAHTTQSANFYAPGMPNNHKTHPSNPWTWPAGHVTVKQIGK